MELAIQKLLHGFKSFQTHYFERESSLFDLLKKGQRPKVLVIACSDSRVDPALLMNSEPGEIFVIRNVANLVPAHAPDENHHGVSAALEYAVKVLEVEHIVVFGHSDCGGIKALMERDSKDRNNEFLDQWLDLAEPAKELVNATLENASETTRLRACEEASLILSLENLLSFPWIKSRIEAGKLHIHAWYFHLTTGRLFGFNIYDKEFVPIDDKGITL